MGPEPGLSGDHSGSARAVLTLLPDEAPKGAVEPVPPTLGTCFPGQAAVALGEQEPRPLLWGFLCSDAS